MNKDKLAKDFRIYNLIMSQVWKFLTTIIIGILLGYLASRKGEEDNNYMIVIIIASFVIGIFNFFLGLYKEHKKMEKFSKVYENIAIQLIRICRFEFDFNQNAYPKWYPIVKGTRLCCHYHLHEKIEIILMDEGEAEFQVSERTYTLKKGDLLMINPFEPHSGFISNECDKAAYYVINIDLDF